MLTRISTQQEMLFLDFWATYSPTSANCLQQYSIIHGQSSLNLFSVRVSCTSHQATSAQKPCNFPQQDTLRYSETKSVLTCSTLAFSSELGELPIKASLHLDALGKPTDKGL